MITHQFTVTSAQTASALRSGDLAVLATPALVAEVEYAAKEFLRQQLSAAETSVGTAFTIEHLRPSAVGQEVTIHLVYDETNPTRPSFTYEAFQGVQIIARGQHQRAVVKSAPFMDKLTARS